MSVHLGARAAIVGTVVLACASLVQAESEGGLYILDPSLYEALGTISAPSVNNGHDLVLRARLGVGSQEVRSLLYDQSSKTYSATTVRAGVNFTPFPVINDARSVAAVAYDGSFSFGAVQRFDYDGGFSASRIARSQPDAPPYLPSTPFSYIAPVAALDEMGNAYFRGTTAIGGLDGIWRSQEEILGPGSFPRVVDESDFDVIDEYVAAAGIEGWATFQAKESSSDDWSLYATGSSSPQLVAGSENGFTTIGSRPGANEKGTVAFAGARGLSGGVFLKRTSDAEPVDATTHVADELSRVEAGGRISVNRHNQIAFVGANAGGSQALFSINLGSLREVLVVGQQLSSGDASTEVLGIQMADGLSDAGQITALVTTPGGQRLVRLNKGYSQGTLADSPVSVPWGDTLYLKRAIGELPATTESGRRATIRAFGCNLTSVANVLNYYGHSVTPEKLHQWLLDKYQAASDEAKHEFINPSNDFSEAIIATYSAELAASSDETRVVKFEGVHNPTTSKVSNREALIAQLQRGEVVKVRVPNSREQLGHYIIAYGLTDPNKPAAEITEEDILVRDPGHGGNETLADFNELALVDRRWLGDSRQRIYKYSASDEEGSPTAGFISVHSPVEIVLTDPLGRRTGMTFDGERLDGIPGAQYFVNETYFELDGDTTAHLDGESIKYLLLDEAVYGDYKLDVFGTGDGEFSIVLGGLGFHWSRTFIEGVVSMGEHRTFSLSLSRDPGDPGDPSVIPSPVAFVAGLPGILLLLTRRRGV